jgi:hypothetical protein
MQEGRVSSGTEERRPGRRPERKPVRESARESARPGGSRVRGVVTFVILATVFFALLRLVHLVIPVFYPQVLSGPFSVDDFGEVKELAGFSPRLPFYRPEVLGTRPVYITVTRRPRPKVAVFWQAEHFLYLSEQRGGDPTRIPASAVPKPLPRHPDARWWREGDTQHVQLQRDGLWIELRTDLSLQDVVRVVDTLRPYEELL